MSSLTPAIADPREPNGIDAVVRAGRTLLQCAGLLLPWALVLEAIKAAVLLALVGAFGEERGGTLAGLSSGLLLAVITALSFRLALDVHAGNRPASALDLWRRTTPTLPLFLVVVLVPRSAGWLEPSLTIATILAGIALLITGPALIDGRPIQEAIRATWELPQRVQKSWLWVAAAFVFLQFSLELIPALADSTVGRKAELSLWISAESAYSTVLTPLWSLAIGFLYAQLSEAAHLSPQGAASVASPAVPGAEGAPSAALVPVPPGTSSTAVLRETDGSTQPPTP